MMLRALDLAGTPPWPVAEPTTEERQRARTMRGSRQAREFIAARVALRGLVAEALGLAPHGVLPAYECPDCGLGEHGAPGFALRDDDGTASLLPATASMSRAGGWALLAVEVSGRVARRWGLGVDLVAVTDFRRGIPEAAYSAAERRRLLLAPAPEAEAARLWARKEALLKSLGTGLRADPAEIEVLRDPRVSDIDGGVLGIPKGFAAALARVTSQ